MGVVCLVSLPRFPLRKADSCVKNVPFPVVNRPPVQPQQAVPQPIQQPQIVHQQQQTQPVSLNNGMQSYQPMQDNQPSGLQNIAAGGNNVYQPQPQPQPQPQQNYQQPQQYQQQAPVQQLQAPFQQQQTQHSEPPQNPGISNRIPPGRVQAIISAAQQAGLTLPAGFDPNSVPKDQLENVLRVIQAEQAKQRILQQQQLQQQQQQQEQFQQQTQQNQQAMSQMFAQQMRSGAGQYMQ